MRIWIKIGLAFLLITPAFAIGGVHILTQAVVGGLACLLAIIWSLHLRRHPERHRTLYLGPWFWLFAAAIVVTALQLVPLPLSWLASLSPETHKILTNMLAGVGLASPSTSMPLSLAPPETSAKLMRDLGSLVVFTVALQWAHQRSRVLWLMKVAVLAAAAMAGLIVVQAILGIKAPLWGLYHPRGTTFANPISMSPFVNPNHMGAYFLFHGLLTLPLLIKAEERRERWMWSAILLGLSVLVVLSLSRGAVLAYTVGLVSFSALFWRQARTQRSDETSDESDEGESSRRRSRRSHRLSRRQRSNLMMVGIAAFVAVGLTAAFSLTNLRKEWSRTSLNLKQDKIGFILRHSKPFLRDYPLWGVGRGAMPMAWSRYSKGSDLKRGQIMVTHIESNLFQPMIDWGIPLGAAFLLVGLVLLGLLVIRSKGFLEHSLLIALLALLFQNVGDFNLEFFGTGFPFLILLAALLRLQQGRHQGTVVRLPWLTATMGVLVIAAIVVLTPYANRHQFYKLPQRWKALEKQPRKAFRKSLRSLVRNHPSDYMLAIYMARRHSFQKPWRPLLALQWLKRGSFLNPLAPEFKMLRAYNLARLQLGSQAIQELEKAIRLRSNLVHPAIALLRQFKLVPLALQQSKEHALVQTILARQSGMSPRPKGYETSLRRSLKRFPKDLLLHKLLAYRLLERWRHALKKARQLIKQQEGDKEQAMLKAVELHEMLTQVMKSFPSTPQAKHLRTLLQAHLAEEQGDKTTAEKHYRALFTEQQGNHWAAFVSLFNLLLQRKAYEDARGILRQAQQWYRRGSVQAHAHMMYLEGRLFQAQGRLRYALRRFESAWNLQGKNKYQEAQAQACWAMGQTKCTLRIYRTLYQSTKKKYFLQRLRYYETQQKEQQRTQKIFQP
ncbi:MAG: hypothetical protein EP343_31775 [Deltaproteobacteria bacterium]|nr:MAG: hypothetical protein EP343_31775 [Deltaproteobacteria bacterium]